MNPVLLLERELLEQIWEHYVFCKNTCYPEARHCENCSVQKRIDDAIRDLDILQSSGMNSGNPDSDKPNYAAASYDPLHKKEEPMSEQTNVQSADLNESAEQTVERVTVTIETEPSPAEQAQSSAEPTPAEQPAVESAASAQPATGYYDRFSGKTIDVTKVSKKAKRSMMIKSILWLLVGVAGLVVTIIWITKIF